MNFKDLLTGALSNVLEYFDFDTGRIYLMDEDGQHLSLASHQRIEPKDLEKVHIHEGFTGKSAQTQSFIAQNVSDLEDEKRRSFLSSKGIKTVLCEHLQ